MQEKQSNAASANPPGSGKSALYKAGALAVAAVGAGIAYSRVIVDHDVPLPAALDAPRVTFNSPTAGRVSYYVDPQASGRPLVLVHSINAAPSAFEMKPLFDHYRAQRPVYALDLPGFGFSDRSDRRYAPALFITAIAELIEREIGTAADVVALSLSAEFAAGVALRYPNLVASLALISPTGFSAETRAFQALAGGGLVSSAVHTGLTLPLLSQSLYDLVASRKSIDYYTGLSFAGEPPAAFADYAYATSHQPGARHAPLYFLSGQLFTPDALNKLYAPLTVPALVLYDQDPNISFERLPDLLQTNPRCRAVRIAPTMGLPHWEKLPETTAALDEFWAAS